MKPCVPGLRCRVLCDVELSGKLVGRRPPRIVPLNIFTVPAGLEVTVWAKSPHLRNPDQHGHRCRRPHLGHRGRKLSSPHGSRSEGRSRVVLEDTDATERGRRACSCRSRRWSRRSASRSSTTRSSSRTRRTSSFTPTSIATGIRSGRRQARSAPHRLSTGAITTIRCTR